MNLVIVESPTKSRTIEKFLGKDYKVLSSFGHIRDLPVSTFGIDIEDDFTPKYLIPKKAKSVIKELKETAKKADQIILATDEDREGEAIAWHLKEALALKDPKRIVFHEITKSAIEEAIKNPRRINQDLVDAQQARRILDRIVGYKLSPFLWKKVSRGLSAGRVQSVAVKFIVDREKEIEAFRPQEYWSIEALLKKDREFGAKLFKIKNKTIDKLEVKSEKEAKEITAGLKGAEYIVDRIEKKETKKYPFPPFTTSTLQQDCSKRFRFTAKMTMRIAQQLYEHGHITYHRTDSLNLSNLSLSEAKTFIAKEYGSNYHSPAKYKSKGKAQEAHEAIRPTYPKNTPDALNLDDRQKKVYDLIWRRFMGSQMSPALTDSTRVEIKADKYCFKANGQILKFDGFLKIYPVKFEENELPKLNQGDVLDLKKLEALKHSTEPPARYTEAGLIKILEENGIGRPSTYAPVISTIQDRNYVEKNEQKRFVPTEIGRIVNDLLVNHFSNIVDVKFTSNMEDQLDQIAEGKKEWKQVSKDFYEPFDKNLQEKYKEVDQKEKMIEKTDKICPKCESEMIIRMGRFGKFYACSAFPKCRHTEPLEDKTLDVKCPNCKDGQLTEKRTRKKKIFYGCNKYPDCDFALWDKPTGDKCEKCGSLMIETNRKQIKCSNKECK